MRLAGPAPRGRAGRQRARELLDLVGVGYCADRRPAELSGGEQQRCAVAVAVANDPEVLFADEPTGELDEATAAEVFGALQTINAELGVTIVVVTHDAGVASQVRRTVAIRDGRTASEVRRSARVGADGAHGGGGRGVRGARPGRPDAAAGDVRGRRWSCATGSGSTWRTTMSRCGPGIRRWRDGVGRPGPGRRRQPGLRLRRPGGARRAGRVLHRRAGRAGRDPRPLRRRQDHAAQPDRRAGPADRRPGHGRRSRRHRAPTTGNCWPCAGARSGSCSSRSG